MLYYTCHDYWVGKGKAKEMSFEVTREQVREGLRRHGILGNSEDFLLIGVACVEKLDEYQRVHSDCHHPSATYCAEHDNYFCDQCHKGMGQLFYATAKRAEAAEQLLKAWIQSIKGQAS